MKKQEIPEKLRNSKSWSYFYDKKGELKRVPKKKSSASKIRKEAEESSYGAELGKIKAHNKIGFLNRLKELFFKKLEDVDPLETAAVIAGTLLLHGSLPSIVASVLGLKVEDIKNEGATWGLSFFLSFILVKHFGNIALALSEMGKGLFGIVEALVIGGAAGSVGSQSAIQIWTVPTSFIGFITPMPFGKESAAYYEDLLKGESKPFAIKP